MSKKKAKPDPKIVDVAELLAQEHKHRIEKRTQENLQIVSAALTDPQMTMRQRRQRAEQMAIQAMRRLRQKN